MICVPTLLFIFLFRETKGEKLHDDILELVLDNKEKSTHEYLV
jgi:hypothetical protein